MRATSTARTARTVGGALACAALVVATIAAGGCDATTPAKPCNEHPFDCPSGQTCWPDAASSGFVCMAAGAGNRGDACQMVAGQPSCAERLICIMLQGTQTGTCEIFCDPLDQTHACPQGQTCSTFRLDKSGGAFEACQAATPAG